MAKLESDRSVFNAYALAIRERESTNNYDRRTGTHLGAYQLGKTTALADVGLTDREGRWTSLAKSLGILSDDDFLKNKDLQDNAFQRYTQIDFNYLRDFLPLVGKNVDGIKITLSGLLAGAYLVGANQEIKFLIGGGRDVPVDGNGTPVTSYIKAFSGFPFDLRLQSVLPLGKAATAVGRAKRSLSVAPMSGIKRVSAWRGRARPPAAAGCTNPSVTPRAGKVTRATGRSSQAVPPASDGFYLGEFQSSSLAALSSWRAAALDVMTQTRRALGESRVARELAAEPKGRVAESVAALRRGGTGGQPRFDGLAFVGAALTMIGWLPKAATMTKGMTGPSCGTAASAEVRKAWRREVLPSIAPMAKQRPTSPRHEFVARQAGVLEESELSVTTAPRGDAIERIDEERRMRQMVADILEREARLPPSGITGFDPRLTPAWAGLKMSF